MIKSLHLSNFQSHKSSELEFSDGVNVILGQSDSGKTALIRALRWAITNKPSGEEFRSYWGGKTSVEIETDKDTIVRSRDKENEYILNGMSFKAFSTDVPKEISDAFNMSAINVQHQLDSPFLLSLSPGEIASHWNKIAKLEMIDKATSSVNSSIRELTADIKYKEAQEVASVEELTKFEHLEEFEADVVYLEKLDKQLSEAESVKAKLNNITVNLRLNAITLSNSSKILAFEKPVDDILDLIKQRGEKIALQNKLDSIVKHINDIDMSVIMHERKIVAESTVNSLLELYRKKEEKDILWVRLDRLINSIQRIDSQIGDQNDLLGAESSVDEILGLYSGLRIVVDRSAVMHKALSSLKGIQVRIVNGNAWLETNEKTFKDALGEVCPLCSQSIKHDHK